MTTLPDKVVRALDRSLSVLGELGKQAILDELTSKGVLSKNDKSAVSEVETYLTERFEKGAYYLISRFRDELGNNTS